MKVVVLVVSLLAASVMSIGDDMIGLVIGGFGGRYQLKGTTSSESLLENF
jgi:hypothetical protein